MQRPAYLRGKQHLSGLLVLIAAVLLLALGIGLRDPWPADEPRFALNALEMLDTGNFWIPHRGGEPYPDKPPIFMWASAAAIALTGSVRLGFLLPSLIGALGTLGLVMDLARRLYGRRIATLTGIALLTTLQFVLQAKTAQIDMLVTLWTTLGAYGLLRHALLGPARRWWYIGCVAMGLGVLTKGVGFLPLLMLPAWGLLAWRGQAVRLAWKDLALGVLVLLATIALWVVPMVLITTLSDDPTLAAYRNNILFKQTGERYAESWHHLEPWYYYLVMVISWAWLPLILGLPWLLPAWWHRARRLDARILLPLSGVVLLVVFFSLSPGKRGIYVLPGIPLLVLAMAPLLPGLLSKRWLHWLGAALLALLGGIFLSAGLLGAAGLTALAELAAKHDLSPWLWWIVLGLSAAALLYWLRPRRGMLALASWLVVFWVLWSTWGYAQLDATRSPRDMMQRVERITGDDTWLAMVDFDEEFLLQTRQPTVHFGNATPLGRQLQRAYAWLNAQPRQRWLFIDQNRADELQCADLSLARDLGLQNGDRWWLIPGKAFGGCQGDTQAAPLYVVPTSLETSPDDR
ncbi:MULTISPECIES: ArnT family glycosyltransferase [Halomonadaceae]|uniref:Glycosyltransferase family 39 protein n=1 Tax=Modicisalibacter zincidurans TaxID=1178777 RepID=A0ABP9RE11_9GAMM|nr:MULTISPECIES: glycosyltransferase family 39 protein [Halomonas]MCD6007568.1 glycosyltransferase family 39 protein [Halomonas sp. IOP_31]